MPRWISQREMCEQAEDEMNREFPVCDECDGRRGIDCEGHEDEDDKVLAQETEVSK